MRAFGVPRRYLGAMASGTAHDIHGASTTLVLVLGVALAMCYGAPFDVFALPMGCLVGFLFLSPDMDMWNTRPMKRWGPLKILWAPYAWLHNHRGVSHSWIVGPLVRLLYFGIPVIFIWWWFWQLNGIGPWLGWFALGAVISNWIHLIGDGHWPWT